MIPVLPFLHHYRKEDPYKGKVDASALRMTISEVVLPSFQPGEAPVFTDSKGGGPFSVSPGSSSPSFPGRLAVSKAQALALVSSNSPMQLALERPPLADAQLPTQPGPDPSWPPRLGPMACLLVWKFLTLRALSQHFQATRLDGAHHSFQPPPSLSHCHCHFPSITHLKYFLNS